MSKTLKHTHKAYTRNVIEERKKTVKKSRLLYKKSAPYNLKLAASPLEASMVDFSWNDGRTLHKNSFKNIPRLLRSFTVKKESISVQQLKISKDRSLFTIILGFTFKKRGHVRASFNKLF